MSWVDTVLSIAANLGVKYATDKLFGEGGASPEQAAAGQAVAAVGIGKMKENQESAYEAEKKRKAGLQTATFHPPQIKAPVAPGPGDTGFQPWQTNEEKSWYA